MKARLVGALWGLSAVGVLGLGLFLCGDGAWGHRLSCVDLLNLPLEDLMEVNILSKTENAGSDQKCGLHCPSPLPKTSLAHPGQSGLV
jgi:hypothetical protein